VYPDGVDSLHPFWIEPPYPVGPVLFASRSQYVINRVKPLAVTHCPAYCEPTFVHPAPPHPLSVHVPLQDVE
jgi:hypothetical protein